MKNKSLSLGICIVFERMAKFYSQRPCKFFDARSANPH